MEPRDGRQQLASSLPQRFTFRRLEEVTAQRATGGGFTRAPKGMYHPPHATLTGGRLHRHCDSRDPQAPLPPLEVDDLKKGVMSCLERGLIPPTFNMTSVIAGKKGDAPLTVAPVAMHNHVDQFRRQEILTDNYGLSAVMNVKLDLAAVSAMPDPSAKQFAKPAPPAAPTPPPLAAETQKAKEREDPREYAELLDLYSLHEFIVRRGQALRNTPEFVSFQRTFHTQWGAINHIITLLEEILSQFNIPLAYIDGKRVAVLASVDLGNPSKEELLSCIANRRDVEPLMVSAVQRFKRGEEGHHLAATKIQSIVRMWIQHNAYKHLLAATYAAKVIQRQWGVHKAHMKTRKTLAAIKEGLVFRWRQTMGEFIANWPRIKSSRRLVVHLPSLSYPAFQCCSMPFYKYFQGSQLPRLAELEDPNVEVVYVSPFQIEPDALQYYFNVLKSSGIENPESRVLILVPELSKRLPTTLSLTKLVLFSSKLLKCMASIVKGKTAFIVPGVVGPEELSLAAKLNLPLLAPEPKVAQVFSTKSGSKSIFETADVLTPVGAYSIKDERDLYLALARCIADYPEYPRWLVKIDNEFGGRGTAFLDVRRLRVMEEAAAIAAPSTIVMEQVFNELRESASKRFKFQNTTVYPDWPSFIKAFSFIGGCVEAAPRETIASPIAHIFIEPDGKVSLQSVQEQILYPQYVALGASYPHQLLPHQALLDASLSIGAAAYRKKIIGYMSIDFVVLRKQESLRLWAVDLDLRLNPNAAMHSFVSLVAGVKYDPRTGSCLRRSGGDSAAVPLAYSYSGLIYHPYIGGLRHSVFFNLCRQRGFIFDTQSKTGVIFHLVDNLLCGCIGVIGVAQTEGAASASLIDVIDFIQQHLSKTNVAVDDSETNFTSVSHAVRNLPQRAVAERKMDRSQRLRASVNVSSNLSGSAT